MVMTCIIIGLCLAIVGVVVYCMTAEKNALHQTPPPLPPRRRVNQHSGESGSDNNNRAGNQVIQSLPIRRITLPVSYGNSGPRGIRVDQFPCCPLCKQRNVIGAEQLIFWDKTCECYRCKRGHKFKSNGLI